ncbi:hypothetical protein CPB84DRAFT_1829522 [Gymnopilus junonius]|uniref:Uncharacterized protein n=1 Tax=Gymnopilus junonius TaxID=109634 RepID=A0A9P5NAT5_GYMJU|nr:hypothetical protein CPB84DRAFT_1829522 [Gymnopilus junonius]
MPKKQGLRGHTVYDAEDARFEGESSQLELRPLRTWIEVDHVGFVLDCRNSVQNMNASPSGPYRPRPRRAWPPLKHWKTVRIKKSTKARIGPGGFWGISYLRFAWTPNQTCSGKKRVELELEGSVVNSESSMSVVAERARVRVQDQKCMNTGKAMLSGADILSLTDFEAAGKHLNNTWHCGLCATAGFWSKEHQHLECQELSFPERLPHRIEYLFDFRVIRAPEFFSSTLAGPFGRNVPRSWCIPAGDAAFEENAFLLEQ